MLLKSLSARLLHIAHVDQLVHRHHSPREEKKRSVNISSKGTATKVCSKDACSTPPSCRIVRNVESASYSANLPSEDRLLVSTESPRSGFYGVFDGHGGSEAAEFTCNNVEQLFRQEMKESARLLSKKESKCAHAKRIRSSLQRAFQNTDGQLKTALHVDSEHPTRATVGTCALAAYVESGAVYVANAGDSRAIIGRRDSNGLLQPVCMSEDHNANQPREQRRLEYHHPDEVDLLEPRGGAVYLKGCVQTTRSIGDFYLKDPYCNSCLKDPVDLRSPPYVSCDAQVFSYEMGKQDEVIVLASDGLWDWMSNEDVLEFVDLNGVEGAAEKLKQRVLELAAEESHLPIQKVFKLPQGPKRRAVHDDISIIVVSLGDRESGTMVA